ncbi:PLP-dependent aminotransferase family protein [Brevibacillus fulvus]|uniref:DNA-binding transcriptional MocR family regulator n=1 Tax=Brevibacillus fulvus TaxID=1125967 RepID=A0A938Y059_9BACL|nr:PLP-dependent aminotransferase family protein [Brevibacillus fulvus]MBM7590951.1 DNA-binding transcriptional MocR family regulator [Brevibacillus fulvus]
MGRKPIYNKVYNQLRYQILSGELPIGSLLPPERKLAEQMGVSRNTIVRAYSELEAEGFISSRRGSGRFVEPLPPVSTFSRFNWNDTYHSSMLNAYPSHMADLLSVGISQPQMVNFAHGHGGKHTLAESGFAEYVRSTAAQLNSYYLTAVEGDPALREQLVSWMGMEQISSPEQVLITSGSQEALYMLTTLLARPGDAIITEMPTYFGSLQLFQSLGMKILPVPVDQQGMRIDVLEGLLARYRARFLYTVPTFHNPTGYTLSLERRRRLLALSEKYQLPIIEDDAYRHLHLEHEPPPSLKSLDLSGNVIYVNTFSKLLFPGLRIGWIAGSRQVIQLLSKIKELSISTNSLGQRAVAAFMSDQALAPHLRHTRRLYREQAETMGHYLEKLKRLGFSYEKPAGGFYYWIALPEEIDARQLMLVCRRHGVSFTCGDMFLLREAEQRFIRLCYTHEPQEQIERGMSILADVLQARKEFSL